VVHGESFPMGGSGRLPPGRESRATAGGTANPRPDHRPKRSAC